MTAAQRTLELETQLSELRAELERLRAELHVHYYPQQQVTTVTTPGWPKLAYYLADTGTNG